MMAPPNETIVRPRHDQFRTRRFRRARIACLSCRRRKVRCNVDSDGTPCINCRLDNCECITHWKRTETDAAAIENTIATTRTEISSEQSARTSGPESSTVIEEIDADDESPPVEDASEKDAASHAETPKLQQLQPPQHFGGTSGDSHLRDISSTLHVPFSYLPFLKAPNLRRMQPADIAYLEYQKCLHIPSGSFLEALISHYFLYVHPCLPIINEADFWKMFRHSEYSDPSFSLLVFQAMLFVASSFIPIHIAKELGGQSILDIRNMYYRRAKLLYDLGVEDDPLRLSKAAVLLSFQSCKLDHSSNTLWLSLAIHHARAANAHLYYRYPEQDKCRRISLKRLWWSIILRDRIIAIGMRRPIQILPDHFDTSSQDPVLLDDLEDEIDVSEVYNHETKKMLCQLLTSQCQLAVVLTPLITTVYPPSGFESSVVDFGTKLVRIENVKARLRYWETNEVVQVPSNQNLHTSVAFYSQLTSLYFESARLALLHHISLCHFAQSRGHLPQASLSQSWNENRSDLIKVLTTINDKVKRFIVDGTASHLPISVVAYTITPQILLNINLRLADSQLERRRQKRLLSFYTELTRVYHVRYDVTHVDGWIERVLRIFESSALHGNSTTSKSSDKASRSSVRRLCIPDSVSSSTGKSFSEFLELRPTLYLQLLKVMDYSMATGREVLDSPSARMRLCYPQESYVFPDSVMATPSLSRPLSFPGRGENLNMTDPEDTSARDAMATYDTMTSPYNFDTEMARTASRQDFYLREGFTPADDNLNESNLTSVHIDNSLLDPLYLEFLEQSGNARKNRTTRGSSELDNLWLDMTLFGE